MKVTLAAPAVLSFCALASACLQQSPDTAETFMEKPADAPVPGIVPSKLQHPPTVSDCVRNRLAEYRSRHGASAPIHSDKVAAWQEGCFGS